MGRQFQEQIHEIKDTEFCKFQFFVNSMERLLRLRKSPVLHKTTVTTDEKCG